MRVQLEPRLEALTERIIGAGYEVARTLGHGAATTCVLAALLGGCMTAGDAPVREFEHLDNCMSPTIYFSQTTPPNLKAGIQSYVASLPLSGMLHSKAITVEIRARHSESVNKLVASRPAGIPSWMRTHEQIIEKNQSCIIGTSLTYSRIPVLSQITFEWDFNDIDLTLLKRCISTAIFCGTKIGGPNE
ncbi:MAG: hypothetical protein H7Y60_16285 [Rhodospirillaceae bacterium]|nr:hypothetical protein [Rhodospirillales bacterium]